jgi:hypothetical protein
VARVLAEELAGLREEKVISGADTTLDGGAGAAVIVAALQVEMRRIGNRFETGEHSRLEPVK